MRMNDMADASPEAIQRLIANSEKGLAQIESALNLLLENRQAVEQALMKQEGNNPILELLQVVMDTILAENEIIYDISASLNALLKATDDYTKRYYMQTLNLCFYEASQLFKGQAGDEDGLLSKIVKLTKQLNQAGCQYIAEHIIDDFNDFREKYTDKDLRNITRHYDDPIKMYKKQQGLDNIDFFVKGVSQLMAIRMEVTVLSSYLLSLLSPNKNEFQNRAQKSKRNLAEIINEAIFKALREKNLKSEVEKELGKGQKYLDDCYQLYNDICNSIDFLKGKNIDIPDGFKKMESIILLRMETLFLRYDIACSVWGYLNAASDMERSQNLRLIHITKQAALTHIYGYNEKSREKSLWAKITEIEEANSATLNTNKVEAQLRELTSYLPEDNEHSRMFAHYRYQQVFYIPARLAAFDKMQHLKELMGSMKLLSICKSLGGYTFKLLSCISEKQKQESERKYEEWVRMINDLAAKMGNDNQAREALKPFRSLIDMAYGKK